METSMQYIITAKGASREVAMKANVTVIAIENIMRAGPAFMENAFVTDEWHM